jgi:uncharacterized LabA/DUF88 family protein
MSPGFLLEGRMERIIVFVDGFNLYHALNEVPQYHKYKWLNLAKLSKCFVSQEDNIVDILYFTAYITWNPGKLARHKIYITALRTVGVKPVLGAFRRKDRTCQVCHKQYKTFEEKQTDVNIAINLFQTAIADTWDTALIISGDSDLIPAINAVKMTFPSKQIGIVIPIGRRAEELKKAADFHKKLKQKHLETCQFDDTINIDKIHILKRPNTWR